MALTESIVEHLARLSHIGLSPEEAQEVAQQLSSVVEHFDMLQQLDTSSIPGSAHALPVENVLREDTVCPSWPVEAVLVNAPRRANDFFEIDAVFE